MCRTTKNSQAGFTIVELMISISVLAVVLLVVTIGIIQISKSYYKGVIQATTQQTARAALDDIAQSVEFDSVHNATTSGSRSDLALQYGPSTSLLSYCIGQNQRYSYVLGYEQSATKNVPGDPGYSRHILWKDQNPGTCTPVKLYEDTPSDTIGQGHELLGANMRLTNLEITPVTGSTTLYKISLTIMYGDDDLIDKSSGVMASWNCKIQGGVFAAAFCAKAELTTVVGKRLS